MIQLIIPQSAARPAGWNGRSGTSHWLAARHSYLPHGHGSWETSRIGENKSIFLGLDHCFEVQFGNFMAKAIWVYLSLFQLWPSGPQLGTHIYIISGYVINNIYIYIIMGLKYVIYIYILNSMSK
jgi:hypothetical protein